MEVYLVGGAVRDELLGVEVKEKDWVITGASPDELIKLGFKPVGKSFPVFLHPDTKEEYALARTEKKISGGYHGFEFDTVSGVTLEEDLLRRDLTVNAMAKNADGEIIDPYNGLKDLADRTLRHVSEAFVEDPVRVLRVARFMSRYERFGFVIAPETLDLMKQMVIQGELEFLVPERIWKEMSRALEEPAPVAFIQVLKQCGALSLVLPELDNLYEIPQEEDIHPERNVGVHTELTLRQVASLTEDTEVRFAALLHDSGKFLTPKEQWPMHPDFKKNSKLTIDSISKRLNVPSSFKELASMVAQYHLDVNLSLKWSAQEALSFLEKFDVLRKPERFGKFLIAAQSIFRGRLGKEHDKYPQKVYLEELVEAISTINAKQILQDKKLSSSEDIKQAIKQARIDAIGPIKAKFDVQYGGLHKR
jgi:tRNA nucleotidyltransferase (CCA-adding enzyme)